MHTRSPACRSIQMHPHSIPRHWLGEHNRKVVLTAYLDDHELLTLEGVRYTIRPYLYRAFPKPARWLRPMFSLLPRAPFRRLLEPDTSSHHCNVLCDPRWVRGVSIGRHPYGVDIDKVRPGVISLLTICPHEPRRMCLEYCRRAALCATYSLVSVSKYES